MSKTDNLFHPICFLWVGFILISLSSCRQHDQKLPDNLVQLDSLSAKYPRYVFNKINAIEKERKFSDNDKAYIGLIKSVAAENMGKNLGNDSLITASVEEYSHHPDKNLNNLMRSLVYQGVARFHTGISDTRAYLPIKEALNMSEVHQLDLRTKQIAFYYLGLIHNKNNNLNLSHEYYKQALVLAESLNDSTILFKTFRDMYWNRMKALDFLTARTLLENIQSFPGDSNEKIYDIKNAESMFYNCQKKYRNALKLDYELLNVDIKEKNKAALLADYYRISENYKYMNQTDSALFYGEMVTKNIVDTSFYLNYHYYLNVAEIASNKSDWQKSAIAYGQVYRLLNRAISEQLNTQILELERKYDVAAAENQAIKLKNNNTILKLVLVILTLGLIIWLLIFNHRTRLQKEQKKSMLQEKKILEQEKQIAIEKEKQMILDKKLTERKLVEKQFVIPIYRKISQRNLDIKNFLIDLQSNSYISKNAQIVQKIETMYKDYIQSAKITEPKLLSDELFSDLTGINSTEAKFLNKSDKMILAFVATGADNQQMATLLNTSVESIRVRKSKLMKKMLEKNVKMPACLLNED